MWKFSLIWFVIAVSPSFTAAAKGLYCKEHFHKICGFSDVITFVNQTSCNEPPVQEYFESMLECQTEIKPRLTLNVRDISAIAPYAFLTTNFTRLNLISESDTCERRVIALIPESLHGLSSLRELELDCADFTSTADPFKSLTSVEGLGLSRMELKNVPEHFFSNFPKLTGLTLREVNIASITLKLLAEMNPGLLELYLTSKNLSVIEGKSFQKLHKLTRLEITDNHLTDLQPDTFDGLNALTTLLLDRNNITVLRRDTFSKLSQLQRVDFSRNAIREMEVGTFSGLPIQMLDLSFNELEDFPAGAFKNLPSLTSLLLQSNKISTLGVNVFEGLGSNLFLNLEHNNIQHIELTVFRGLHLRNLKLNNNKLSILEPDTFNGLNVDNRLHLACNDIVEIKEYAFRNLTAGLITLPGKITEIDKDSWGASVWKIERSVQC